MKHYTYVFCLALPNATEYQAALELEMWKLSEEEAFREQMKTKEAAYFDKLGEEWSKREVERQKILAHKVHVHVCFFCTIIHCSDYYN